MPHKACLRVQLLSRIGPFDCAWGQCFVRALSWCHVYMLPRCHLDKQKDTAGEDDDKKRKRQRTKRGQQKGKKRTEEAEEVKNRRKGAQQEDKKRTGSGQNENSKRTRTRDGLVAAPSWKMDKKRTTDGQVEDNKKTTGGHSVHRHSPSRSGRR